MDGENDKYAGLIGKSKKLERKYRRIREMKENTNVLIENVKDEVVLILATIDSERFLEYFMQETHDENTKRMAKELVNRSKSATTNMQDTNQIIQILRRELEKNERIGNNTG